MRLWPREIRSPELSIVPVLLGCSVAVPILLAVLSAEDAGRRERAAETARCDPNAELNAACEKLGQLFRPAILSSFRVRANAADVAAAVANPGGQPPVQLGDWVEPRPFDPRPGVHFRCSAGLVANNTPAVTGARELEFALDEGETNNGADDDGDGLIDEGMLWLRQGGAASVVMTDVEVFSVALQGRSLRLTLGCALRDKSGDIDRAVTVRDFLVRNT